MYDTQYIDTPQALLSPFLETLPYCFNLLNKYFNAIALHFRFLKKLLEYVEIMGGNAVNRFVPF